MTQILTKGTKSKASQRNATTIINVVTPARSKDPVSETAPLGCVGGEGFAGLDGLEGLEGLEGPEGLEGFEEFGLEVGGAVGAEGVIGMVLVNATKSDQSSRQGAST